VDLKNGSCGLRSPLKPAKIQSWLVKQTSPEPLFDDIELGVGDNNSSFKIKVSKRLSQSVKPIDYFERVRRVPDLDDFDEALAFGLLFLRLTDDSVNSVSR
jgi:hypothetical protein